MMSQWHLGTHQTISNYILYAFLLYLPLEWIHSNLEWIHSNREWIHSKSLDDFLEKCSGPAQNNILWKIFFGINSTKIFRVLATTFSSQFSKKLFNPSMNSFQYGMNVFQVRMNSFHMGMYSYYYRYSHTVLYTVLILIQMTTSSTVFLQYLGDLKLFQIHLNWITILELNLENYLHVLEFK